MKKDGVTQGKVMDRRCKVSVGACRRYTGQVKQGVKGRAKRGIKWGQARLRENKKLRSGVKRHQIGTRRVSWLDMEESGGGRGV